MELPGFGHRMTPYNQLPQDRLLDENAPLVFASIRDQPLALVRPQRYDGGPERTIPITLDRLQRDYDLRRGYTPGPFVQSLTGIDNDLRLPSWITITIGFVAIALVFDYARKR